MKKDITICWFGIYRKNYSRNYVFLDGLKELNVKVVECNVDPKERFSKFKLLWKFLKIKNQCDVVYAAFPAQSVVPIARLLTRKPVIMDAFYSMYEGIVRDRKLMGKWHPFVWYMAMLDWVSIRMTTHLVVDTQQHKDYWQTWGIKESKISVVPVGTSSRLFFKESAPKNSENLLAHFHGTYIPLQGADVIIEAAALCMDDPQIKFRLIGSGQTFAAVKARAEELQLTNVEFLPVVPLEDLNGYINESDITLGIFGETDKAKRVVPNKLYEALGAGKPIITLDTPAVRTLFSEDELYLVERSPEALAKAVKTLKTDKVTRKHFALRSEAVFQECFSETVLARQLLNILQDHS